MTTRTISVEALAAALIPVTRGLWGIEDMTAWRKRTAAAIFAALPAAPAEAGLREALVRLRRLAPADLHDTVRDSTSIVQERFDIAIYADDYRAARAFLAAHAQEGE